MRILLIEDEPAVARMVERGLTPHGHQVLVAVNRRRRIALRPHRADRSGPARHHAPRAGRPSGAGGDPAPAQQPAGDHADRPRRPRQQDQRARQRRRRLHHQTVRLRGAAGPHPGTDPPRRPAAVGRRSSAAICASTLPPIGSGAASSRSSCPAASSRCSSTSLATRAGSSPASRSSPPSGSTTSRASRTSSTSTSATCAPSSTGRASRRSSRPCAAAATASIRRRHPLAGVRQRAPRHRQAPSGFDNHAPLDCANATETPRGTFHPAP